MPDSWVSFEIFQGPIRPTSLTKHLDPVRGADHAEPEFAAGDSAWEVKDVRLMIRLSRGKHELQPKGAIWTAMTSIGKAIGSRLQRLLRRTVP